MLIKIDSTKFGEIVINGKKYGDVLIIGKKIIERDIKKARAVLGTSHKITDEELKQLLEGNPEIIIVGTGQAGVLEVDEIIAEKIKEKEIELIVLVTPRAIEEYNRLIEEEKKVNGLFHATC